MGWLVSGAEEGVLEVLSEGRSVYRVETPRAEAHFTTFPRPSGDVVLLRYGTLAAADLHTTVLYLREDVPRTLGVLTGVDSLYVVGGRARGVRPTPRSLEERRTRRPGRPVGRGSEPRGVPR